MAKYQILKIRIIMANLLGYSFCLKVFSSLFKVHTKVKFGLGRKFRLVETVTTWPVTCFGWKPLLLIRSHLTSGLLALRWYSNKVPQSLAHCVVPGTNSGPSAWQAYNLTTKPRELLFINLHFGLTLYGACRNHPSVILQKYIPQVPYN